MKNKKPAAAAAATSDGLVVPLLLTELESSSPQRTISATATPSISGAVFNVSTSIIGAGIMSIPATVKVLGVIPVLVMIVTVAILAEISVEFLLRFTEHSSNGGGTSVVTETTYASVMRDSFGQIGSVLVQFSIMATNWGALIIYLIIIGDVVSGNQNNGVVEEQQQHIGVLQDWFGFHWWNQREYALLFIVMFILLPLVLFNRVDSLRFTSAISVLLAVVFVGITTVMAITSLIKGKAETPRLIPTVTSLSSFFDLFTTIPVIVTAFTFHFNVHPIASELEKPYHMTVSVRISLFICCIIYFTVGLFGYLLFGDTIMSDILINFDTHNSVPPFINHLVRLSYAFHLILVYPLINFPLRSNIDEFLFHKWSSSRKRFVTLSCVLLGLTYVAAIAFPDIWLFFQFIGSTSAVCLAFIFPGAIVLRDVHGITTRRDRVVAWVMVVVAVVTSGVAIVTNVYNANGKKS